MDRIYLFLVVAGLTVLGSGRVSGQSTCTSEQLAKCIEPISGAGNTSPEEQCRTLGTAFDCMRYMGPCDDNPTAKAQREAYYSGYRRVLNSCRGCTNQGLTNCTGPLEKMQDTAGSDVPKMCQIWYVGESCLRTLIGRCDEDPVLQATAKTIYANISDVMEFCDDITPASTTQLPWQTTNATNSSICTFDTFRKCQAISSMAEGESDKVKKCRYLKEARDCYNQLRICRDSEIQRYLMEAFKALGEREQKYCSATDNCTLDQFRKCVAPLSQIDNDKEEEACRITVTAYKCLEDMGSCESNFPLKMQMDQYKQGLKAGVEQCSQCTMARFETCTNPLITMETVAGSDYRMMCKIWWDSKACLNKLEKDCEGSQQMKDLIGQVIANVTVQMSFCDAYSTCSEDQQLSCMSDMQYANNDLQKCSSAKKAESCLENLRYGCQDPDKLGKLMYFIDAMKMAQKETCHGDGDGDGPSGAASVLFTLPLLGVMSLVAMMYN